MIDDRAVIHPEARIDTDVTIGAYAVIGAAVEIGAGSRIDSHTVVKGPTRIGRDNHIYSFCSIGDDPQDKKFHGEPDSRLQIGDSNTIREYCSINRGTETGGGVTRLGNNNWVMASVHIAHDCLIGDNTIFANYTGIAGHAVIEDNVILAGYSGIHQYCRVGMYSMTAISSIVVKDVPPYLLVAGNSARPVGLNREGLKRNGFDQQTIELLRKAYKIVYRQGLVISDALEELAKLEPEAEVISRFARFIAESKRGIVR